MTMSGKIKEARKFAGLTQNELAQKANVTRGAVVKWENGTAVPDLEKLMKLSELLNVEIGYLIGAGGKDPVALVHEITGLSEDAVKTLISWKNGKTADKISVSVLSRMLARREAFGRVLCAVWNYIIVPQGKRTPGRKPRNLATVMETQIDTGSSNIADVRLYTASLSFSDLVRPLRTGK